MLLAALLAARIAAAAHDPRMVTCTGWWMCVMWDADAASSAGGYRTGSLYVAPGDARNRKRQAGRAEVCLVDRDADGMCVRVRAFPLSLM